MEIKRKALLISTRQKAKYLAALLQEAGGCTQIRLIKGRHNSLELLCKRLPDYSDTDLFVFDLAAIAERKKEADLVYELKNISEESKQKPIVVYAPDMNREASTAKALLEAGKILYPIFRKSKDGEEQIVYEKECIINALQEQAPTEKAEEPKVPLPHIPITKKRSLSVEKLQVEKLLKDRYKGCFAAYTFVGGNAERCGNTYAAIATALFFRMCEAKVLFLFQKSEALEKFKNYYCPNSDRENAVKKSNFCGYEGYWYRENTREEELLFLSALDCKAEEENSQTALMQNVNFVIVDSKDLDLPETMPMEYVIVTSCGFIDDEKARDLILSIAASEDPVAAHAISFGDEQHKRDFQGEFDNLRHYLIPFLPEMTAFAEKITAETAQDFAAAFPPELRRFYDTPPPDAPKAIEVRERYLDYRECEEECYL